MVIGRVREMLRLNQELDITVMGPRIDQLITSPFGVNPDLWLRHGLDGDDRLHYVEQTILPNALATRYDFNWEEISSALMLPEHRKDVDRRFDVMYINDPMLLRNYMALFHVVGGYQPRFFVHSHFIDEPRRPKFPKEASLWLGQCEAAIRANYNFWQCESAMNVFFDEMRRWYSDATVANVLNKSTAWDDGYSISEITSKIELRNLRFSINAWNEMTAGKTVVFVPNRIGGRGRSSDYTNCGKFVFDVLPELHRRRQDFVVITGNPSQKFSNDELHAECAVNGHINLVPNAFTRDEYRFVANNSDIVVGLYNVDAYGGTAARECVDMGAWPLWIDNFEYASIAREAGYEEYLARPDMSNIVDKMEKLMNDIDNQPGTLRRLQRDLKAVVRQRCSYESTTPCMMMRMGLLDVNNV